MNNLVKLLCYLTVACAIIFSSVEMLNNKVEAAIVDCSYCSNPNIPCGSLVKDYVYLDGPGEGEVCNFIWLTCDQCSFYSHQNPSWLCYYRGPNYCDY